MNLGNIYISETIVAALILTNTVFTIICMIKTSKTKQSLLNNVDDAVLDRLVSIVGDCCMKYMYEMTKKHKNEKSKQIITPEDVLSYIEEYIKQKYTKSDNDESKTYYKDLLNVFYTTYESSRQVVINIMSNPNKEWDITEKEEETTDISA